MPIYEFECKECGNKFEKLVLKDDEIKCTNCGSSNIVKLISLYTFKLKGKGWANDGYSKK